ncbi:MAG: DUF4838 domain-containing protein [Thermoguttaceae bacterium]
MQANLLQWIWTRLFLCLLLAAGGAIAHTAETRSSIVVGCGPFPSLQAAAVAEEQADWLDADQADDNACTQCFAAAELQRYLRRMTGRVEDFSLVSDAQLPQSGDVILVGQPAGAAARNLSQSLGVDATQMESLGPEGYRIKSRLVGGQRIVVVAGRQRVGTLYGAYDLLYRLGCRWFAPGELSEDIPPLESIPDLDLTSQPSFLTRGFLAWGNRGNVDFLLWMARNRLDCWTLEQQPQTLMRKLGLRMVFGRHDAEDELLGPQKCYPYAQALIDGPYRHADILRFWALDAGKWCECEACRAQGTPTDRYMLLVHRFCQELDEARAAGRLHRPLTVTFLVYADVVDPPKRPLPAGFPPTYCAATFFPICHCYVHHIDDPTCAVNARYWGQLAGWTGDPQRTYRGAMAIGEYYNVSRYKCLPICFMHAMAGDIPAYYRTGARHFDYMHVTTARWGTKALTNYQMARQLWDVETDCEALWTDYFARRYGPAAAKMRQFYESLEQMLSNATELKYGLAPRLERGEKDLFPTAQLRYQRAPGLACDGPTLLEIVEHGRRCRQLLSDSLRMALPAAIKARIVEDEECFTYGERTVAYYHACVQALQQLNVGRRDAARPPYAEAQRLAELLRNDAVSTQNSSSHANVENAFAATGATRALEHIAARLEAKK